MESFDISRVAFDPKKHYAGVRMQQGRVLTDDDWNENERIENEERRRSRVDIIGPYGSPDQGFEVTNLHFAPGEPIDFAILQGQIYLGGLHLQMDRVDSFRNQMDWEHVPKKLGVAPTVDKLNTFSGKERFDLIYLEAWQQAVSAMEDQSLFEPALGGPDTTTRVRNMRRVSMQENIQSGKCSKAWHTLRKVWEKEGKGHINRQHERIPQTKLKVSIATTYQGVENQAIRVQIVNQNEITWGFDNAAPLYRVQISAKDRRILQILTPPKDQYHWPQSGQTVEILPWSANLNNDQKIAEQTGVFRLVSTSYSPDKGEFELLTPLSISDIPEQEFYFLRVWNRGATSFSSGETANTNPLVRLNSNGFTLLGHTGLGVTILGPRIPGDYWVIAARPESSNLIIPWEAEHTGISPHGVRRFYAPLAIIRWFIKDKKVQGEILCDCRKHFPPLIGIRAEDVRFDNYSNIPDFAQSETVQDAMQVLYNRQKTCTLVAIPGSNWQDIFKQIPDGGDARVCFQVGTYDLEEGILLKDKGNITFAGCGDGTEIIVKGIESAFTFENCKNITIRDISATSLIAGITSKNNHLNGIFSILHCESTTIENITLTCADGPFKCATCVTIRNVKQKKSRVSIQNSKLKIGKNQIGILIVNTEKCNIQSNYIISKDNTFSFPAYQGIVVAGEIVDNVHIINNTIHGVFQGIHIGTSHKEYTPGAPDLAGTVIVSGNNIHCFYKKTTDRGRHGIFVGNCNSLVISDNYLLLDIIPNYEIAEIKDLKSMVVQVIPFDQTGNRQQAGSGLLFAYRGLDYYIATARCVVESMDKINISTNDSQNFYAEVIGFHKNLDLAILKFTSNKKLPTSFIQVCQSFRAMESGVPLMTIGYPAGNSEVLLKGLALKNNEEEDATFETFGEQLVKPGYFGGPIFNERFELLGMCTGIGENGMNGLKYRDILNYLRSETNNPSQFLKWPINIPSIKGICVFGYFGKRVIIKHNHLEKFSSESSLGIYINYLRDKYDSPIWIVEENVATVGPIGKKFINVSNFA